LLSRTAYRARPSFGFRSRPEVAPADATVAQLRMLVNEYFRREHQLGFCAEKPGMAVDRLNDHVQASPPAMCRSLIISERGRWGG
jgi:hypothetical protein